MNSENDLIHRKLNEYKSRVITIMNSWVPNKEPKKYLYNLIMEYPNRDGKGFRPSLCISTYNCFGGIGHKCDNTAAALELLHNAFLVHDDVQDDSIFRRGVRTINQINNNAISINLGDAMNLLSLKALGKNKQSLGVTLANRVFNEIQHMLSETLEGQAIELGWRKDNVIDLNTNDYFKMILKKTCWYTTIYPIRLGYMIASNKSDCDKFYKLGYFMGLSFQIQDDILNLKGDQILYGKETCGDIVEGKRTLMLIDLLTKCTLNEKDDIRYYLSNKLSKQDKVDSSKMILNLMRKYGSIEYCIKVSKVLAGAAIKEYVDKFEMCESSDDKEFMKEMILFMINRKF